MPLLTDKEAKELAAMCPPHKIIINGNGLIGTVQAACTLAYQPEVYEVIQTYNDIKALAYKLAMAMHDAENALEPLLKELAFKVAEREYGDEKVGK